MAIFPFLKNKKDAEEKEKRRKLLADLDMKLQKARTAALVKAYKEGQLDQLDQESLTLDLEKTWKDEYFIFLFSLPVAMVFIPFTQDLAKVGFDILNTSLPDIYIQALVILISVIFGIKKIPEILLSLRKKN